MARHKVVLRNQWLAARKALLVKEKKFTKLRDQLSHQRRQLPWVKVEKNYVFDGPNGRETLSDLFEGKSQLIVYHFMARYGALQSSGLIHNVKPYSFLYQLSVGVGPYGKEKVDPRWEIEFALSWDSGIFVDETGQSRKEFFWSVAATYAALRMETWNDSINHKDKGPTYGFTITLDLLKLFSKVS